MTHRDQVEVAKAKILELEREKQRIESELQAWIKIRDAHQSLAKTDTTKQLTPIKIGKTEAILIILGKHPAGLTPMQIRAELESYGIKVGNKESQFIGNIHTIIKRHKDIESIPDGGRTIYRLKK